MDCADETAVYILSLGLDHGHVRRAKHLDSTDRGCVNPWRWKVSGKSMGFSRVWKVLGYRRIGPECCGLVDLYYGLCIH